MEPDSINDNRQYPQSKRRPIFIKEEKKYSKSDILTRLDNDSKVFDKLLKNGIIVPVNRKYKVKYVGLILIEQHIINCYPKYITNKKNIENDFKQVLHVIRKYNRLHEDFTYQNEELEDISFYLLYLMLFFIEDYYENGVYKNIKHMLEIDGKGEINWDRTINNTFPIIKKNKPYYTELYTKYHKDDLFDFFRLLHECIITECSKFFEEFDLLDYFDLMPVELSDRTLDDFGDRNYILNRLEKELNIEFNTHKQRLLRSMHIYISKRDSFSNMDNLALYGTSSYYAIWEDMCSEVFDNKLDYELRELDLEIDSNKYNPNHKLKEIIEKPNWVLTDYKGEADDTFILDTVSIYEKMFIIFDAKYYNLKIENDNLIGQPGIPSITKQYFYELSFRDFIKHIGYKAVNAFLLPTYNKYVENKGYVELKMFSKIGLENIQIIMLPANEINELYLNNKKMDISRLNLEKHLKNKDIKSLKIQITISKK